MTDRDGVGPLKVKDLPQEDTITVKLKVYGRINLKRGRDLSARVNQFIAYWNTILERAEDDLLHSQKFFAKDQPVYTCQAPIAQRPELREQKEND